MPPSRSTPGLQPRMRNRSNTNRSTAASSIASVQMGSLAGAEMETAKAQLELTALELRIEELKQPVWRSPAVLTSIVIAAATGLSGYFSGFFQIKLDQTKLETEKQKLELERTRLEKQALDAAKTSLNSDIGALRTKISQLEKKGAQLAAMNRSLQDQYSSAMAPKMAIETTSIFTAPTQKDNRFSITLRNSGNGPIKVLPFDTYADGKYIATIGNREDWLTTLKAIDLERSWIRLQTIGLNPQLLLSLAPHEAKDIMFIAEDELSRANVQDAIRARNRLGAIFCYCSQIACSTVVFGTIPDEVRTCRSNIKRGQMAW